MNLLLSSIAKRYIYLHGFASSPDSAKAIYLRDRFSRLSIPLEIPELNQGDFSHLTITRQVEQIHTDFLADQTPVTLIGSSLGGLTAAWLGQNYCQIQQLVLLAPAFDFLDHWLPEVGEAQLLEWQASGYMSVYHYGEQRSLPLHYQFVADARQYQTHQLNRSVPTLIIHGKHDQVIPILASQNYTKERPWVKLIELNSDHSLADVMPEIWQLIQEFCQLSLL